MATPWNPNDPNAVGVEFLAELTRSWTVGSTGGSPTAVSQRFRSTAAESSPELQLHATAVSGSGYLLAEIMEDDGSDDYPLLTDVQIDAVQPDDVSSVTNFVNQSGSTTPANLLASIDEAGDPSDPSDWIAQVFLGLPQGISVQFDAAQISAAVSGRRILGITIGIRTLPRSSADLSDLYQVRLIDVATGVPIRTMDRLVGSNTEAWFNLGELYTNDFDVDLAEPWTATSLAELATGGDQAIRISCAGGDGIRIGRVRMVIATADENRAALAVFDHTSWPLTSAVLGDETGVWSESVELVEPDLSGGWSKATATTYRLFLRRAFTGDLVNGLNVTVPVLSRHDSESPPSGTFMDEPMLLRAWGISGPTGASVPSIVAVAPAVAESLIDTPDGGAIEPSGLVPFRLLVAGVDSADGQTYSRVMPLVVSNALGAAINQYVTTGAGGDYSAVRCVLGFATDVQPDEPLTVEVRDSTGVTTLATGTVDPADFRARPDFLGNGVLIETIVEVDVTLSAATQYRLRFDTDAEPERGWLLGVYTSRGGEGQEADWPDGAATYGGVTDYAFGPTTISDPVLADDVTTYLGLALDGPTDLLADGEALSFTGAAQPCGIELIPFAELTWTASELGVDFARYVVQRRDSVDDVWQDVAYITDEDVEQLDDVEARLGGIESEWRIRAEGPNGETSLWLSSAALPLDASGCGYTFSSNWSPSSSVGYVDVYDGTAERGYDLPGSEEVQVRRFAGRDEFVVFRPLERRSERFQRRLLVRAFTGPSGIVGPEAWKLLRDLTESSQLPYICVRDEQGNRWYAGVICTSGSVRQPSDLHRVEIDVVPVVGPSPPTMET